MIIDVNKMFEMVVRGLFRVTEIEEGHGIPKSEKLL
jgi:hypothetical protein